MLDRGDYWQCAYVIPKGGFDAGAGDAGSRRSARSVAAIVPFLADRVDELAAVGRRQAADGHGRSPAAVVPPGPALHRRRGARDVADRRRRHQPRDPGRRGRGEHLERPAGPRRVSRLRPGSGAEEARVPDSRRPAGSAARAGFVLEENPGRPRASKDAVGAEAPAMVSISATDSSEAGGDGNPA